MNGSQRPIDDAGAPRHSLLMGYLCRICLAEGAEFRSAACPACGSACVVSNPELHQLSIAHIDCDSFYASVEKRDNPALRDKPVLVGGQKPDMAKYGRIGRDIREMMRNVTPLVEPISIDEAFLDLTGTERLHGGSPARTLGRLSLDIAAEHGITVSVGLSHNKFLAKLSSGLNKPHGFTVIGRQETVSFLKTQPVSRIWGVGKVFQRRLERDGITLIGQLQHLTGEDLTRRYGEIGGRLARLSHGRDDRKVVPGSGRKSLSSETTFADDISDIAGLSRILWRQAEKVSGGVKKEGIGGRTVTLKLKTSRFATRTRSRTLPHPTQLADAIYTAAAALLAKEADGTPFRLLGVGLSDFAPQSDCDPIDLADPDSQRRKKVESAVDDLRARFGRDAIGKGRML